MSKIIFLLLLPFFVFDLFGQPELKLVELANGFSSPVVLTNASDDSNRLFVVERGGIIKIINELSTGSVLTSPFIDLSDIIESGGERGLLGLAFHPGYPATPYFYVNYTFRESGQLKTRVERYTISGNPDIADIGSGLPILEVDQPYANHNAGDIKFGPDGYLYITMGDGGSGEDPDSLAQNTMSLLGSLLRIDVDGDDFPADPKLNYSIPASNPFVGMVGFREEFWAIGLRNPWRISFDRITGDLWIGDVGQSSREEVNHQLNGSAGGQNYGWSCKEGLILQNFNECIPGPLTDPIFEYPRSEGHSITGGYVYRGSAFSNLQGYYIMADYSFGNFWMINSTNFTDVSQFSLISNISTFGESESGELYAARLNEGIVYRIFDQSVCESELIVINHNNSIFSADSLIISDVPVLSTQQILYYSPTINLDNPFEVEGEGEFRAEAISCTAKIMREQN